ncbi:MAG: penicillin-binding protein activator [Hyphomicrobiales bacterium]
MSRRFYKTLASAMVAAVALTACVATGPQFSGGLTTPTPAIPTPSEQIPETTVTSPAPANGTIIGRGPIRVAMLLPKSAAGFGSLAAENFANAASLALREFDENAINIVVKDTGGTAAGAANATREALNEGAELILGPVFSKAVPAAVSIARPAGIPVITFSNSSGVGSRGTYVFGFTPEPGIKRAIQYAGNNGRKSFAALLPNNAFGTLAEAAFRQSVASAGGRIVSIVKYSYSNGEPNKRAQEIGALAASGQIDAVFVPDAGDVAPQLVTTIKQVAPSNPNLLFIGSGQWDDPRIFRNSTLAGAIYPAPERSGFNQFAQRYNGTFGKPPIRLASLGYDAASLMIVLTQNFKDQRFAESNLTNPSGFKGVVDGTFRLETSGQVKRSFAVYEVTVGGPRIVAPAPRTFAQTASSN